MKYANFRDKLFKLLFETYPADERLPFFPECRVKKMLQQVCYNIDRVFMLIWIGVMVPFTLIVGLIGLWLQFKGIV